jgi:hypothetical protein
VSLNNSRQFHHDSIRADLELERFGVIQIEFAAKAFETAAIQIKSAANTI